MVAHIEPPVSTTLAAVHPAWCTQQRYNAGPALHQSPEILLGTVADIPVKVERIHVDPEPGYPEPRDEMWISFGPHSTEVPLDEAAQLAQQLRQIAAALELILGGAR